MTALRLAIISTHPIQYYAPIFQLLARSSQIRPRVFYTWSQTALQPIADQGFGKAITWDIPLLEGYEHEFVPNVARRPGTDHFRGLQNPQLIQAIESWGADAVLVFAWNLASHLQALRYFKGRIPVFFRGDSTLLRPSPPLKRLARRAVLSWVYRHIDVAIAVGSNNRDYFRWCGVPGHRIGFAPHAVDTARFADPDRTHSARAVQWRQELGIPAGARTVLFAAKFQPIKDPFLLLDAFAHCKVQDSHLIFVGNGELERALRARAQGGTNIHFLPFQNQQAMPSVYRLGDVFVLPSLSETWGLALNEAMASDRIVIASDKVGAARDLITEGSNGWVFRSRDRAQLTDVLQQALTIDAARLNAMSCAARERSTLWSSEAAAAGIERAVVEFLRLDPAHPAYA